MGSQSLPNTNIYNGVKEITQATVGEKYELQAVFGSPYPGGKDLEVDRRGQPREPYATQKFVLLSPEDRQKIMDEFQITAENWPMLVAVYYRTQLFPPVEVHAEDLDTVSYLTTFIGVPLFRVAASSTASIRSELAAVRETALRALQFTADMKENGRNAYEQQCKVVPIWLLLEVCTTSSVRGVG